MTWEQERKDHENEPVGGPSAEALFEDDIEETITLTGLPPEEAIVRKSFRIPVTEDTPVSVTVQGTKYQVVNFSEGGIAVTSERSDLFAPGDPLPDLVLVYGDREVRARGEVRHVTPSEDGLCLYGLSLEFMDPNDKDFVMNFVQEARERFFSQ